MKIFFLFISIIFFFFSYLQNEINIFKTNEAILHKSQPVYASMQAAPITNQAQNEQNSNDEQIRVTIFYKNLQVLQTEIKQLHGTIINNNNQLQMLVAVMPRENLSMLLTSSEITYIERDKEITIEPAQVITWDRERVKLRESIQSNFTGKGIKVAVIDTGIALHDDLQVAGGISFVDYTTSYYDDNGHGTHVAGIIAAKNNNIGVVGIAPDVQLYSVKVLDFDGSGYISDLVEAIQWSIENDMDILNISSGSLVNSQILERMINAAYENGLLIVAAAGNDGTEDTKIDTINYPGKFDSTIAVGALDENNQRAIFSSTGSALEISAPGENIVSTYLNNGYISMSGTSMATPVVSGIVALLKEANPNLTNIQLRSLLQKGSIDLGMQGRDSLFGYGLAQAPYYFPDIYSHWAKTDIIAIYKKGWLVGKSASSFAPEDVLTRAQAAVILSRILGLQPTGSNTYKDVRNNYWAISDIIAVTENQYMVGIEDGKFGPEQVLTREQFAAILDRVFIRKNIVTEGETYPIPFIDVDPNGWSANAVARIANLGVIRGTSSTKFSPQMKMTRAQIAAMLNRSANYFE
ncbi:S8 family serine peptidase [Caldibacillus lycopersici]|uniref:S8 family serine peptidase n=1 Tax=Perspicuibacillus lycopersici TaxID=1325689 RepID=A0AAE3LPB0_9BACI|nr:S8 family serine peptidase [Perspicuibacillus lycopersici]MCU9614801.1 S8 family serine peptidase [Perspicuibacillus lycopersici]